MNPDKTAQLQLYLDAIAQLLYEDLIEAKLSYSAIREFQRLKQRILVGLKE